MPQLPFTDRIEAGRLLGEELLGHKVPASGIVLALPRGGVPVGFEVAAALRVPLDVEVVRKLGVPWQPELAMGALAGGSVYVDRDLTRQLDISEAQIDATVAREAAEAARRERLYRDDRPAPELGGRTVVLVDDGLATGSSMLAAVHHVRSRGAARIVVAVPVSSVKAYRHMTLVAGECVCLATPEPFSAVGLWYRDFTQVTDSEVRDLLARSEEPMESPSRN